MRTGNGEKKLYKGARYGWEQIDGAVKINVNGVIFIGQEELLADL